MKVKAVRMFWCALSLCSFSLYSMEIEERRPLLSERDLEAQWESHQELRAEKNQTSRSYLDLVSGDVAYAITHYIDGKSGALPLMLEKATISEGQAEALYKKMIKAQLDPVVVAQELEKIKNESNRKKLKAVADKHEALLVKISRDFLKNKTSKIRHYLETEIGSLEYLRGITAASKDGYDFKQISKDLNYYSQTVNNLKNVLDGCELRQGCASFCTSSNKFIIGSASVSALTFFILALYGGIVSPKSFDYSSCLQNMNISCTYNVNMCNQNRYTCCVGFSRTLCGNMQQSYYSNYYEQHPSAIYAWAPLIIASVVLATIQGMIQIIARACIRPPELSARLKKLVRDYAEEVTRLKGVVRNVLGNEQP